MIVSPAFAQAAGTAGQSGGTAAAIVNILPMVLIVVAFYFLMIRPQQRRMKELRASIDGIKKGDSVVTAGGLIGKVVKVEDNVVEVELGPQMKVRVVKATIAEVTPLGGKPAND